ncbi:MAG: SIS domain-containing protein [Verrucomicrobiia bacterium]
MVQEQLEQLKAAVEASAALVPQLEAFLPRLRADVQAGAKVLSCGNGGSAADALHLAEELVGRYRMDRKALPGIALCGDPAAMTCIANDWCYEEVFARQVEAHGRSGDWFFGISTSGNSENVLRAIRRARELGLVTVAMLGKDGGRAKGLAEIELIVPCHITARVQEIHTWIIHVILEELEQIT